MVWRSLSDITFSCTKELLVDCREQIRKKDTEFDSKVSHLMSERKKIIIVLKCKKCFFLRNLTKISNLILCFSGIPKIFICASLRQMTFLSASRGKLSVWSSALFAVSALEMRERKAHIKQTGPNVCVLLNKVYALEHDRFMQVSHTVSWLFANTYA